MRPFLLTVVLAWLLGSLSLQAADQANSADGPDQLARKVDEALEKRWRAERLIPSVTCTDYEFHRRVSLDLVGAIPSAEAAHEFVDQGVGKATKAERRQALVDALLDSPSYGRQGAVLWGNTLVGRGQGLELLANIPFREWLADELNKNTRFDQVTRELLVATGRRSDNRAVGWAMGKAGNHEDLAGSAARVFLGTQIQCAQCHDHPFDKWKQTDFYGLAAFFARVKYSKIIVAESLSEQTAGEIRLGGKADGAVIAPRFLGVEKPAAIGGRPRREALADWLTSRDNQQFARAIVNRVWAQFFGRGFVHPVDDFSESNPPSCPEALDALAEGFAGSGYDLKFLIRAITRTRAYQLSSLPSSNNKNDEALFSKHPLRRLMPEQIVPSVVMSSGLAANKNLMENGLVKLLLKGVEQDFIFVFANMDETTEVSEFKGTISQALLMMNGKPIVTATRLHLLHPLAIKLLKRTPEEQVQLLFLSTVSRPPTPAESAQFVPMIQGARGSGAQLEVCEDLYWALINSAEFSLNH